VMQKLNVLRYTKYVHYLWLRIMDGFTLVLYYVISAQTWLDVEIIPLFIILYRADGNQSICTNNFIKSRVPIVLPCRCKIPIVAFSIWIDTFLGRTINCHRFHPFEIRRHRNTNYPIYQSYQGRMQDHLV
jgi:hypothetical protein